MFNVGAGELIFILVAALLILGPTRLPELARGLGKFMREFRRQTDEVRGTLEREFYRMDQELAREEPAGPTDPAPAPPPAFPLSSLPPAPLEAPLAAPPPEPAAAAAPLGGVAPALEPTDPGAAPALLQAPGVGPEEPRAPDALPHMAPVPGTVARNALKRAATPPPSEEL